MKRPAGGWLPGERPSLALDTAGNPRAAFDARHQQSGGCQTATDLLYTRVASFNEL